MVAAAAEAAGDADNEEPEAATVENLGFGSDTVVAAASLMRSSRSVAALTVVALMEPLLPVLEKRDEPLVDDRAADAPTEPARGRAEPAASGCASEF